MAEGPSEHRKRQVPSEVFLRRNPSPLAEAVLLQVRLRENIQHQLIQNPTRRQKQKQSQRGQAFGAYLLGKLLPWPLRFLSRLSFFCFAVLAACAAALFSSDEGSAVEQAPPSTRVGRRASALFA